MIANCPSCGTHFKHQAMPVSVRARCGRCDSTLDLTRFRQYRIVRAGAPALAATAATAAPGGPDLWSEQDPLPAIPEMAEAAGAMLDSGAAEAQAGDASVQPTAWRRDAGEATTFFFWVAAGAIAGTGVSWTAGGTTVLGLAAGAAFGVLAGWGWIKWMSPR